MHAAAFLHAVASAAKEQNLAEAFDAIVAAYYEEYTDATELDDQFQSCLEHIFDTCFQFGETPDGREFNDIIRKKDA